MNFIMVILLSVMGACSVTVTGDSAAVTSPIATAITRPGTDSDKVDLFDEQGDCAKDTKRALFTYRRGAPNSLGSTKVEGCWVLHESKVFMMFNDGDRGAVPTAFFEWAQGMEPKPTRLPM